QLEQGGGGAGSCKDSAGVSQSFENARFSGQPAVTKHFRRPHRLLTRPPGTTEIHRIFGDIVEAPGTVASGTVPGGPVLGVILKGSETLPAPVVGAIVEASGTL